MVEQVSNYDPRHRVTDPRVLKATGKVPRHEFVPIEVRDFAYENQPLPAGEGQTISQPFIVGYMTQVLELKPKHKVLEIGPGSGYQAAVLAEVVKKVYTIEIVDNFTDKWAGGDLNPQASRHTVLSRARLPFRHPPHDSAPA